MGTLCCRSSGKSYREIPTEPLGLRLEAADEQVVESLVVALDTRCHVSPQVLLDADHHVCGLLVEEPQLAGG